jgi:serine/threonine protein kinase/ABC-type sugar transport system substrate-binding protein
MENWSGQLIKGYELRERIGAGGFGAVYRAHQSTVGREVAMKIILPGFANQPDFIRRFESEAQIIARLEHLHITPLYDYWRDPDGAYLVMRWLKGGSLRDALQKGAFDLGTTAVLLDQIASALQVAHRSGVIHRDLKPGNILLDEDGNGYLADFGIAKDLNLKNSTTEVDAIIGSPDYLSPEQARSEPVTPQTDIYSLGVVLYEMLAGQHPFPNLSIVERLYKHLNEPLPELQNLDPAVQGAVNAVIQKATTKNPAYRYGDALAMAAAFRAAALANQNGSSSMVEVLTRREQDILQFIIDGRSNKEIAATLYVTIATVKWYITQIYRKLGVRGRVQAIVRARELNLISSSMQNGSPSVSGLTAIPGDQFQPDNPYKGLRAFQAADERDFFGREKLVEKLVKRMGETSEGTFARFLAVIGPSGSGKSSLVKAGLIPALWRGDLPGSEKWFVIEMLPGAHPLDELEVALTRVAANTTANLREQLERDVRGLLRAAQLILPDDGSQLVLVIDQFEEVFTLVEDEAARQHFLNLLLSAANETRSRVRIIVTLRADFYDRPLHYPEFGEMLRSRMETVLPLGAQALERAIAGPAERVGVQFEEGLVASIVAEMNYQTGALPLLQYALTELFEHREGRLLTHKAYQEIGGAVGALAKRAEALYIDLLPEAQAAARQMFLRLVTLGEGVEDTRRRAARSELLAITTDSDLMDDVIDTYADYRLLTLDNEPGTRAPTVELAHEAILREWERLRAWLNESRDEIRLQRQLAHAAEEWRGAKQDSSFLLRGARLETIEKWVDNTKLALTPEERSYLTASVAKRDQETAAETERQAREARLERRSITFLRGLVAILVLATMGAFGLTSIAQRNEQEARGLALASAAQLSLNEGNADQAVQQAEAALAIKDNQLARRVLDMAAYAPAPVTPLIFHDAKNFVPRVLTDQKTSLTFAIIAHFGPDNPFGATLFKGMEDACSALNIVCHVLPTGMGDPSEMRPLWDRALALKPDAIATTIIDVDEIRGDIETAAERSIPVMVFNSARDQDYSLPSVLYIGGDEYSMGQANARRVFDEAKSDGVTISRGVCALQAEGYSGLDARCAGVASVFEQHNVTLDHIYISDDSSATAAKQIADYFSKNPNTNAIFMLGPGPAHSLNLYLKQADLQPRHLYATTHDIGPEIFQMLREGYLLQTVDQQPYVQGFQTIISLYLYRQYGLRPSGFINTSSVIDRSNVEDVIKLMDLGYR